MVDFIEFDVANSMVIASATAGMGLDNDGNPYYLLRINGFNSKMEEVKLDMVVPPMLSDAFVRVVQSMGSENA